MQGAAPLRALGTVVGRSWGRRRFRQWVPHLHPCGTVPVPPWGSMCSPACLAWLPAAPQGSRNSSLQELRKHLRPAPLQETWPWPTPAHTPAARPGRRSHSQEIQRPGAVLSSATGLLQVEGKQSACSVACRREQALQRPDARMGMSPRHGSKEIPGKLGHPCPELHAAARLTWTLTEAERRQPLEGAGISSWPPGRLPSSSDPLPGGR